MILNPVTILKHDSCYTYALKRTGIGWMDIFISAEEFIAKSNKEPLKKEKLRVGDILYIKRPITNNNTVTIAGSITKHREIIQERVHYNLHFAVYEGEGLISELVRIDDSYVLEINLVRLEDIDYQNWNRIF